MTFDLLTLVVVLVSVLLSMTLHEAMHAYASYWLGDDTAKYHGRLTLNPLAHIDPFTTVLLPLLLVAISAPPFGMAKPVPFDPNRLRYGEYGSAIVGAAGPLTNLGLAVIVGIFLQVFAGALPDMILYILGIFTLVNLSFFLFNIIPFPPLDGSRILYAFAPDSIKKVMEQIEASGIIAIGIFFMLFYFFLSEPFGRLLATLLQIVTGSSIGI